jgi:hypothetical protein
MSLPLREGRLRPRFAALYPDLTPGVWVPACTLKDFVLERGLYRRLTGSPAQHRPLPEDHFDFRGGRSPREPSWAGQDDRFGDLPG